MKYYSQAGQDRFVHNLIGDKGTFVDIGSGGHKWSNTLALEGFGWNGWLMDIDPQVDQRNARFFQSDATQADWSFLPDVVDYLSLDIDGASFDALQRLNLNEKKFKVITIEHDAYRFGDSLRQPMRDYLTGYGYDLLCADVSNPVPFEDWWVNPEMLNMKVANKYRSSGKTPQEILCSKF